MMSHRQITRNYDDTMMINLSQSNHQERILDFEGVDLLVTPTRPMFVTEYTSPNPILGTRAASGNQRFYGLRLVTT
eukprot:COSAG01_NODE_1241_length_11085_cov_9.712361_6_plen_76_part_00